MKKFLSLMIALVMVLSLAACGSSEPAQAPQKTTTQPAEKPAAAPSTSSVSTASAGAFAEYPILITSGGQSADYQMVATLMGKKNMQYVSNNLATSADLGDAKTVIVVVGGSSKGLGAAGIDADGELARIKELLDTAKAKGLSVIVMHTGGEARRGDLSDKFITPIFAYADYAIVVAAGDKDGLMSGICAKNNIRIDTIEKLSEVATVLPAAFK